MNLVAAAGAVVIPAYNEARSIRDVAQRALAQVPLVIVVDDGSTDGTAELVRGWAAEAPFPVRYLRQENRGKHLAVNWGVAESVGEMIVILDSDDACVPAALERFAHHWRSIPDARRERFYAVVCHCADPSGRRVGDPFPAPVVDAPGLDVRYRWKARGEMWGAVRADLMRARPFPDKPERTYIPESVVWDRLALTHLARFVDEALRVYHLEPGEGSLGSPGDPARHAWGSMLQHRVVLDEHLAYFPAAPLAILASAAHYVRFSLHAGVGAREQRRALTRQAARALWWIGLPVGCAAWAYDRLRRRARRGR